MTEQVATLAERRLTLLGYGAYGLLGWTSVLLPSLINEIQADFGTGDSDFGIVYFFAALLYGIGALGGAFLTERTGPRLVLLSAFGLLAAMLFGNAALTVWILFAATISISKAANGAIDAGFGALFMEAFSGSRGSALNLLHFFYALGALLAPVAIGLVITLDLPWRGVYLATGFVAIVGFVGVSRLPWAPAPARRSVGSEPAAIPEHERSLTPFVLLAIAMGLYEAQVLGITAWIVRYLRDEGAGVATASLTAFWIGVCISRLLAGRLAALTSTARLGLWLLAGTTALFLLALFSPWTPVTLLLLVIAGFFSGPIYPLLIAIGGDFYPNRLSRLSGGMTAAATVGALICPPLIGFVAEEYSVRLGLLGAAALGFPAILALAAALSLRPSDSGAESPA